MKRLVVVLLVAVAAIAAAGETPSGDDILRCIEENFRGIDDYTVTMLITVDLERLKVPPMNVTMYYKQPDRVHFSSRGFALLPKESIAFTRGKLLTTFEAEEVKERSDSSGLRYELTLKPRKDRTHLRRLLLTVNPEHWTPEKLASPQFDGRTMEAYFRHQVVEGRWLPAELEVVFSTAEHAEEEPALSGMPRQSVPRNGRIVIRFSDYRLNSGLDDALFVDPEQK